MPIENEGSPTNWTLRFKHGRITVLLLTEALTPLSILKSELLDALRDRYPAGLPNPTHSPKKQLGLNEYIPIPEDAKDIALAVPIDVYNTSKGWKPLATVGKDAMGLPESPKTTGIKDNSVLAFRFRAENEGDGEVNDEELYNEDDDKSATVQEFVVEWPSYDDTYGEADREDVDMDKR